MSDIFNTMPPLSYEKAAKEIIARKDAEIARLQLQWIGMKDEVNLCYREIAKLQAECERLRTWLGDSEMTVTKLRAALEEIANRLPEKWPDQQIARKALDRESPTL